MKKYVVFWDLETQNKIEDQIGRFREDKVRKLSISCACTMMVDSDLILQGKEEQALADAVETTFWIDDKYIMEPMLQQFDDAELIIGFNTNAFAHPVLSSHYNGNRPRELSHTFKAHDIFRKIIDAQARRWPKLDKLLALNGEKPKIANGLLAIQWWANGERQKLEEYCKTDVRLMAKLCLRKDGIHLDENEPLRVPSALVGVAPALAAQRFCFSMYTQAQYNVCVPSKKRGRNALRLSEQNPFPFDQYVDFDENNHIYTVNGKTTKTSVTSLIKNLFPASANFDPKSICQANLTKWRSNSSNRYYDIVADIEDDEEAMSVVMAVWEKNKDLGTLTNKAVELVLNDEPVTNDVAAAHVQSELDMYLSWHNRKCLAGWKAIRTELALFHTRSDETIFAGQIDILYKDDTSKYRVVDIKRTDKELHKDSSNFGKWGIGPAASLKDTDFYKYSLQTWIYTLMFQRLTGNQVGNPLLVQVHPQQTEAHEIICADIQNVAHKILEVEYNSTHEQDTFNKTLSQQ